MVKRPCALIESRLPPCRPSVPHLVARIDGADLTDVEVVQGHEELGAEGAVVHVPRAQEQRP